MMIRLPPDRPSARPAWWLAWCLAACLGITLSACGGGGTPAPTGSLAVTVSGLPAGADAGITVTGPEAFEQAVTASSTLTQLAPGSYTVAAVSVTAGGDSYAPDPASQQVDVAAGATAQATVDYALEAGALFVNPLTGSDDASGSEAEPLKTLGRALALASSGDGVYLQPGTYQAEAWPLLVPAGVSVAAVVAGNAVLASSVPDSYTALTFPAGGSAKHLRFQGFDVGVQADGGAVTLEGLTFSGIRSQAIRASGEATVTVLASSFTNAGFANAAVVAGNAALTVTGGAISGGGAAFVLEEAAALTLANVTVDATDYTVYAYQGGASLALANVTITNTKRSAISLRDTAMTAELVGTTITGAGEIGISTVDFTGSLTLNGGSVQGASSGRPAVQIGGKEDLATGGSLTIQGTQIVNNAGFGVSVSDYATADIAGATITGNGQEGINAYEPFGLKVRGSTIANNGSRGIYLRGYLVATSMVPYVDLGTASDPGQNVIQGNVDANLYVFDSAVGIIQASGNYWNGFVQGAAGDGSIAVGTTLTGPVSGSNFIINLNNQLWF